MRGTYVDEGGARYVVLLPGALLYTRYSIITVLKRASDDTLSLGTVIDITGMFGGAAITPVGVFGNTVLLNQGSHLLVVDVSNPETASITKFVDHGGTNSTTVIGNYVYGSIGGGNTFDLVDVSDPKDPKPVALPPSFHVPTGGAIVGAGNRLYIQSQGISVVDITDPRNPKNLGSITDTHRLGAVSGTTAFLMEGGADGTVLDASDGTKPVIATVNIDPQKSWSNVDSMILSGDRLYAFATSGSVGVSISGVYDVRNPLAPVWLSKFPKFQDTVAGTVNDLCLADGAVAIAKSYGVALYH